MEPAEEEDEFRIQDLHIEDAFGDADRIEQALRSEEVFSLIPVLAQACITLCALHGVDPRDVEGGTFLRNPNEPSFFFLPGLIPTPSQGYEQLCQERLGPTQERQRTLAARLDFPEPVQSEIDLQGEQIRFLDKHGNILLSAHTTLIGSFSEPTRTWAWAWGNTSLPESLREPSHQLCDQILRRDLWEITTPQFPSDLGTARELVSLLLAETNADGFYELSQEHHVVFLLLSQIKHTPPL